MIRPFTAANEAAVLELWSTCGLVVPQNDPVKDIRRKERLNPELFLVAEEDGKIIGTCMAGYEGHRGWINYLAVSPDHRRRGLGTNLVREAERLLREAGCPKINLQVRATNSAVIAFYEAIGFSVDSVTSMGKRLEIDSPHCRESASSKVGASETIPPPPEEYAARIPPCRTAEKLAPVGLDFDGRDAFLEPETATKWKRMKSAAFADGIELLLISGFRSPEYQAQIVRKKLTRGLPLPEILRISAYPGFSEHHTGRAIDIGCPGFTDLTEVFESTPAFAWLENRAAQFGFALSFPRHNRFGIAYEPWHWARH